MRTAKEAAHVFDSVRTIELLTGMTVFLGITGRNRPSLEFSLYMKITSALYQKTIQGKLLQYINTMRTATEAARLVLQRTDDRSAHCYDGYPRNRG